MPKETISKLKVPESAVKKIEQPFASFGGRPAEKEDSFYVRVSERLRHKSRAITIWDYEHLVLEEFPLIHKVKCLNHTRSSDEGYNEVLPGHVTIITIPDLQQRNDINPLKPYTSQDVLAQIKDFLKARISCHVKLHVVNPDFEEVQLKFRLKLAKGYDDFSLYANLLKQEITDFLSPWATGKGDISFGGLIHKSVVIDFIEERPYVDFITDVEMAHYDAARVLVSADNDSVRALFSKSILVSVPASKHEIEEIVLPEAGAVSDCPKTPGKKITNKKRQIRKDV
ncbi:MAG: baseplate J/gp47 family protein [Chitinophagaceae bacterium]|nr:baseplate J/gp47 family protein [Chitinophagaceae bacterium]